MKPLNLDRLKKLFGEDSIYEFSLESLQKYQGMTKEVKNIFLNIGLPYSAAPEFQFDNAFNVLDDKHLIIGDGIDFRPIVLDIVSGAVFEGFNDKKLKLINAKLSNFLLILMEYAEMVEDSLEVNGNDAYLKNNIPDALIEKFREHIINLESESLVENAFWSIEINRLFSHIED